jgi:hypothetical protein
MAPDQRKRESGAFVISIEGQRHPTSIAHDVVTDSPLTMLEAEKTHRVHAIVEQVIEDLKSGALAHLPSGHLQTTLRDWCWPRSHAT